MSIRKTETRDQYGYWLELQTRFQDGDPYGHVNNAVFYSWMDTALTTMLIEKRLLHNPELPSIGLCVQSGCDFYAPIAFPERVDAGLRIGRIGNSSVRYEIALFRKCDATAAAAGHFVHVFVDRHTRRPKPLEGWARAQLAQLMAGAD